MKNKMYLITLLSLGITFLLVSCGRDRNSHHGAHQSHADSEALKIELNNSEKWELDNHTRSMFQTMLKRIEAGGAPQDIGTSLSKDLDKLIQGCTMTGQAHNQLHVYLVSYIPSVQKLKESGSVDSLDEVKEILHEYPKFFK